MIILNNNIKGEESAFVDVSDKIEVLDADGNEGKFECLFNYALLSKTTNQLFVSGIYSPKQDTFLKQGDNFVIKLNCRKIDGLANSKITFLFNYFNFNSGEFKIFAINTENRSFIQFANNVNNTTYLINYLLHDENFLIINCSIAATLQSPYKLNSVFISQVIQLQPESIN